MKNDELNEICTVNKGKHTEKVNEKAQIRERTKEKRCEREKNRCKFRSMRWWKCERKIIHEKGKPRGCDAIF